MIVVIGQVETASFHIAVSLVLAVNGPVFALHDAAANQRSQNTGACGNGSAGKKVVRRSFSNDIDIIFRRTVDGNVIRIIIL